MTDPLTFATVRQLAKLQYWATRALGLSHADGVERALTLIVEFADDLTVGPELQHAWHVRIAGELHQLERDFALNERSN